MRIRSWVKRLFSLYDIEDLQIGAHCGLCGEWMPNEIAVKGWAWSLCDKH